MPFQMHLDSQHCETEEFVADRPATIVSIGHHLATTMQLHCLVRTISRGGAVLDISPSHEIPSHFFLEILGIRDEIGCTLVRREGERATISFNMLIDPDFLHHVLRLGAEAK